MVRVLTREELQLEPQLVEKIKNSIFIYPTDTIYGIGCDATNEELVAKVRRIKQRFERPFSVILPDKSQISKYCDVHSTAATWLEKLPGPYTLILKLKGKFFAPSVNPGVQTVGIRVPDHWFCEFVKKMQVPIVTTSVNITGEDFMTSLEDLNYDIKKAVDFIIYDGPLRGRPSTVVHLDAAMEVPSSILKR